MILTDISFIKRIFFIGITALIPFTSHSREVARFSMENADGTLIESISGKSFDIRSNLPAENISGAKGKALRFDGYSTYIEGTIGDIIPDGSKKMTASIWLAIETYPVVEIDVNTSEQIAIASCLDDNAKKGFGFYIGFDGKYSFKTYMGGWPLELKVEQPIKQYEWINLTAVIDTESRTATLYNNGVAVANSKANGTICAGNSRMRIGRSFNERFSGPFCLTSFNGAIDDITVWDEALSAETIASQKPENKADLVIPASRFADDPMRPIFHGMPGANWTNETHGLTYYNGRYHLFFQKNGNGPYMSRLHWGHLSSENLYDWKEENIAITPGAAYDIKGCWSGCVFSDNEITQGKPSIIYTAVDYARAVIAQANPDDENLISWSKNPSLLIGGRPNGLSDDFRDPYFFRADNGAYIIVGSSKGGVGTTTLHQYNPATKNWSNDGKTFFTGTTVATAGTFWEMPNVTKMGDKWLFTVTPQNTSKGVASLYWVGSINSDGTFTADKNSPSNIEFSSIARNGYGLLSPSICQYDGKTIALGIVPDKLPSEDNHRLGYAHAYSLPREWTLDNEGNLCQKPFSGLTQMRSEDSYSKENFTLDGILNMEGVAGRAVELCGEFIIDSGKCGFSLLDDGNSSIKVYYNVPTNEIVIDCRGLDRLVNDAGVFDGFYRSTLPKQLSKGETLKLNVFFDHSILDVFVNDTWASSVRIFAKKKEVENITAFTYSPTQIRAINGWNLKTNNGGAGMIPVFSDKPEFSVRVESGCIKYTTHSTPAIMTIYNFSGSKVIEKIIDSESGTIETELTGLHILTMRTPSGTHSRKIIF